MGIRRTSEWPSAISTPIVGRCPKKRTSTLMGLSALRAVGQTMADTRTLSLKSLLLKAHVSFTLFFPIRCLLVSIKNGGGGPKSLSKDVKEGHCAHLWLCTQMQL